MNTFTLGDTEISILAKLAFESGILIVKCLLTIIFGIIADKALNKVVRKTLNSSKKHLSDRKVNTLYPIICGIIRYGIYFIVICQILSLFGIGMESVFAVIGVGSVAIGFGAQGLIKDFITGIFIIIEDQFGVGDVITVNGLTGKVESLGMRTTRIRSADANLHIIPNSSIAILTNHSSEFNRAIVDFSISYEEDTEKTIQILDDEIENIYKKIEGLISKPILLGITELAQSGLSMRIIADCKIGEKWRIEREIRLMVKNRLAAAGISVPYQQSIVKVIND